MKSQSKKGLIELCALALLNKNDYYGYDISTIISNRVDVADGTIYPILRKMKNDGWVTTYLTEGEGGPPRKYYQITKTGRKQLLIEIEDWLSLVDNINDLLEVE